MGLLAYMYVCDASNSSVCNTEMVRWITYGREGMWLTDISPYLFMLNDGEERQFKYGGANRGDLTVTFLFSDWGSGQRAVDGTYASSGGQFDGTYNNECATSANLILQFQQMRHRLKSSPPLPDMGSTRTGQLCGMLRPPVLLHHGSAPDIRMAPHRLQQRWLRK